MVNSTTSVLALTDDEAWIELHTALDSDLHNVPLANILERLKAAGVCAALDEADYLDRDYSAEFHAFYGRLFRQHRRHCRRLHFFTVPLGPAAQQGSTALVDCMEAASANNQYLGFLVVRPVRDAPVGRAVLALPQALPDIDLRPQVRADYETHPLGATLVVRGIPFTQQDARVSACAQATIWMSGRHVSARHGGPWFSTVAITEAASTPTDVTLATALPAGSMGLSVNNMLRALRAMDLHPYMQMAERIVDKDGSFVGLQWPGALDPAELLARYVGSGIPVIVGLAPWMPKQREGHAIVVVGDSFRELDPPSVPRSKPSIGSLSPYFLVHDDQVGPLLRMGVERNMPDSDTEYNVRDHVEYMIVPLPDKVYVTAESAEVIAWDYLRFYVEEWDSMTASPGVALGTSVASGGRVVHGYSNSGVIARTYLTFGWKYKQRILRSCAHEGLKEEIAFLELPKMVWVTELGLIEDLNKLDPDERRIFGHCVIDATSKGRFQPPVLFHAPGFVTTYKQQPLEFFAETISRVIPLEDDQLYKTRVRGRA